jgi:hypothetical protein
MVPPTLRDAGISAYLYPYTLHVIVVCTVLRVLVYQYSDQTEFRKFRYRSRGMVSGCQH